MQKKYLLLGLVVCLGASEVTASVQHIRKKLLLVVSSVTMGLCLGHEMSRKELLENEGKGVFDERRLLGHKEGFEDDLKRAQEKIMAITSRLMGELKEVKKDMEHMTAEEKRKFLSQTFSRILEKIDALKKSN